MMKYVHKCIDSGGRYFGHLLLTFDLIISSNLKVIKLEMCIVNGTTSVLGKMSLWFRYVLLKLIF